MNIDRFEGQLTQLQGKAKQRWGKLNNDHLTRLDGHKDQLVGMVQEAYGVMKDDADKQVREFLWEAQLQAWSDEFQGSWTAARGAIKEQWGKLTDDEIAQSEGEAEKIVGLIQREYGMEDAFAVEDLHKIARELKKAAKDAGL